MIGLILSPNLVRYILLFDYSIGVILISSWLLTILRDSQISGYTISSKLKINWSNLKLAFPFLFVCVALIVFITLYTPLIYQYDAISIYLIEGKQLVVGSSSITNTWPTFGDGMPVVPILYSWFYVISTGPLLRIIPISLFLLTLLLTYAICKRLFPEKPQVAYAALISLVTMMPIWWYMAGASLYLDLVFIFFTASSIYVLIYIMMSGDSNPVSYLLLGVNLLLLILCKEFGILYAWFIIILLLFWRYRQGIRALLWNIILPILLLVPFILYDPGFSLIFYRGNVIAEVNTIIRVILLFAFGFLLFLALRGKDYPKPRSSVRKFLFIVLPLLVALGFIAYTFFSIGSPFGSLQELYVQKLSPLD